MELRKYVSLFNRHVSRPAICQLLTEIPAKSEIIRGIALSPV
jgi:hypothetical protein